MERVDDDLRRLADEGKPPAEIFDAFAIEDIRAACDLFTPLYAGMVMVPIDDSVLTGHRPNDPVAAADDPAFAAVADSVAQLVGSDPAVASVTPPTPGTSISEADQRCERAR